MNNYKSLHNQTYNQTRKILNSKTNFLKQEQNKNGSFSLLKVHNTAL